jgi:hypothetical protein
VGVTPPHASTTLFSFKDDVTVILLFGFLHGENPCSIFRPNVTYIGKNIVSKKLLYPPDLVQLDVFQPLFFNKINIMQIRTSPGKIDTRRKYLIKV